MDRERIDSIDRAITHWMARHGVTLLRWSIGVIFIWFGALKLVPGLSPADAIATETAMALTLNLFIFGFRSPLRLARALEVWTRNTTGRSTSRSRR